MPPHPRANFNCQDFKNALLGIPVEFYCIVIVAVNTLNGNYQMTSLTFFQLTSSLNHVFLA